MTTLDDISARLDRLEQAVALTKNVLTIADVAMLTGYTVKYLRLLIARHELTYYRRVTEFSSTATRWRTG